jgi:hypothetical protein
MIGEGSIPAISIRQPWAELILRGVKTIEIRDWERDYRGDLYLHTGKVADGYRIFEFGMPDVFRGGYIGIIELVTILPFTSESWKAWQPKHLSDHHFIPGTFAWVVQNSRRFQEPIPAPGKLGLFEPDQTIIQQLKEAKFA